MATESAYLKSGVSIDAFLDVENGTLVRKAEIWRALRSHRSDVSTSELKVAAKDGTGIYLKTLDANNLPNFCAQLNELLILVQLIERANLPIRLVENYSSSNLSVEAIKASIAWYQSRRFEMVPSIIDLFERLKNSDWRASRKLTFVSGCMTVEDLPPEFDSLSEVTFAIAYHIRQRLDVAGYHKDSVGYCLRVVDGPANDVVRRKLLGTRLAEYEKLLSLTTTIIKWASVQLFFEPDLAMEFVQWCELICSGHLPVGWHGTNANGMLLLYENFTEVD